MKITHKHEPFDHHLGRPDTTWHAPLIAAVTIIAACWLVLVATALWDIKSLIESV